MFFQADRLRAYEQSTPEVEDKPLALVPDFVVEIISPTDSYQDQDVERKVAQYLADGVTLVWVVNPREKVVSAHVRGTDIVRKHSAGQTLSGDPVLPGLEIAVSSLFG